ncbi:MAG: 4-hydroxyphenylacetate decarboxylase activase [Anaerolineales bacterium]|nr:4-hydroxyphenylacetate decarboxylase activase [Anaerolineales bacterium]
MVETLQGLIFDIQGYSVHDGPGVRTLIFMKGCPLRCEWCSNPEGMHFYPEILFRNTKCTHISNHCSRCIEACPHGAIRINPDYRTSDDAQLLLDRETCHLCKERKCLQYCYFEGLRLCGEWKTVDEVMHVLQRNQHYWGRNGGVSFSGGEPFFQPQFLYAVLEACHERKMHKAVETTAYVNPKTFLEIMPFFDFAFIDIKHMDPSLHKEKTGVSNDLILDNIQALHASNYSGRLVIRMPVIEGFNDNDENIEALAEFMNEVGLYEINILPFHRLGASKWNQLGKTYCYESNSSTAEEKLSYIQDIFLSKRIACYTASDTPF